MTKIKSSKTVIAIILIAAFALVGVLLLVQSRAATPFLGVEAEAGTKSNGAVTVSDSTASGSSAVRFGTAAPFAGAVKTESVEFAVKKGSFGSLTPITNKGYAKKTILQVADSAPTVSKTCPLGKADTSIDWTTLTCDKFEDTGWRQQGLAGVGGSNYSSRSDVLLVSWHNGDDDQARLTVLNKTTGKQTYVELVRACDDTDGYCKMASPDSQCSGVHAGGLAWYKNLLYVADSNCFMMYDLNNLYEVKSGVFVLPATHYWKRTTTDLTLSTVNIDLSGVTPQIIFAQYDSGDCKKSYFGRFNLDPTSGDLKADSAGVAPVANVFSAPTCYVQGIAFVGDTWLLATSGGGTDYVYRYRVTASAKADTKSLWPPNTPQGLYVDPTTGVSWGMTENHGDDDTYVRVFGFKTTSILD